MTARNRTRTMISIRAMLCAIVLALSGCAGVELDAPQVTEAEAELTASETASWVCDATNCVAICVACVYRSCRESGAPYEECVLERDLCIEECNPPVECRPGQPCDP
jgi:hypothetical protein